MAAELGDRAPGPVHPVDAIAGGGGGVDHGVRRVQRRQRQRATLPVGTVNDHHIRLQTGQRDLQPQLRMIGPIGLTVGDIAGRGNHPEVRVPPAGHREILGPAFGVLIAQDCPNVHSFRRGLHPEPLGGGRAGVEINEYDLTPFGGGDHC